MDTRTSETAQKIEPTTESLQTWLVARLAELHGVDPTTIDVRERFGRYGLDSLRAAELLAKLGAGLGRVLSPTLVWDHPTIEALARHLSGETEPAPERAHAARGRPGDSEPIAVVGMACRFPGAPDLEAFWRVLRDGVDAITEVPAGRWDVAAFYDGDPAVPGKMATRWGGFLDQVEGFDPLFFGISPREAERMDPQQRLMLELAWEALDDAGAAPEGLKGSRTGVFFGAMWDDYARRTAGAPETISPHTATGQDLSIIPARVSYTLGLQGPSLAVNTACSSSLVAVHLACQSLREGESEVALAGGVNLILSPESTVAMSKFGGLSPDGRCFTFDARANGYVRSEGGGVVVLKALSRAIADGDRIHCVLRGSAVNNDGASNGLTAPNPRAQEAVLREAYERAGVDPATVDYVEAHGTGTQLGDPIEARALGAVLGAVRPAERPLLVGSAKANVGHLEAAAGVVGLIKVALCLEHGAIPRSVHFETPNPHIPFAELHLSVPRALVDWPEGDRPRTAGISSFGFGGTNAHLVVQSTGGLRVDVPAELSARPADSGPPPRVVFVFSGQGSQWLGMGRSLLGTEPVFRAALEACDRLVREHLGWSVLAELTAREEESRRDEVDVTYPLVVSLEIALAALWRSWGVEPSAVVGHSIGEVAAAHVAGVLSLEDAMRVICMQGWWMRRIRGQGAMGLVALSWDEAGEALRGYEGRLCRAIHTGPAEVVLSGEPEALAEVLQSLESRGVFCRRVNADVAPHSAQLDPLREVMAEALRTIAPRRASIPLFSSVTGGALDGACLDAHHWVRSLADPLQFARAVEAVGLTEPEAFVEIGPHPVVGRAIESILRHAGRSARVLSSLRRDEDERRVLLDSLRALEAMGQPVKWDVVSQRESADDGTARLLPLSAAGPEALAALARSYSMLLRRDEPARLHDIVYTAAVRRSHLPHRLAVVGRTREELANGLDAFVRGRGGREVVHGVSVPGARPKVVFVFSGQGSQWVGMGRSLLAQEPVFRAALEDCDALVQRHGGFSLLDELTAPETSSRLDQTEVVQPALFAVQVGLAALLRSWGVAPEAVIGHSVGEVAAAHVAGALSLEQAVRLVVLRGRIMQRATGLGKMASVALSAEAVSGLLKGYEDRVSIAAVNDPGSVVLSGETAALTAILEQLEKQQVTGRLLRVDYAFHSPQMAPFQRELVEALGELSPMATTVAMYSTVTGAKIEGERLEAGYWARNLREPVQLAAAVAAALQERGGPFVEVGPHPVLLGNLEECLSGGEGARRVIGTLRRGQDEARDLLRSLGALHTSGVAVDWKRLYPEGGRCVSLPTYPWQRQRCWIEASKPKDLEPGAAIPVAWQAMLEAKDGATFAEHLGLPSTLSLEELSTVSRVLEALREKTRQAGMDAQIREWLYTPVWRSRPQEARAAQAALAAQAAQAAPAHWVVLVDEEGVGERLTGVLEAAGATCSRLRMGPTPESWTREAISAWWAERVAERGPVRGVVHLWSLGAPAEGASGLDAVAGLDAAGALDAALSRGVHSALSLVQAMAGASHEQAPRLWLVTRGAMSVGAEDLVVAPEQATLWGLGRVVSLEHPELWGGLIDLPAAPSEAAEQALLAEVLGPDGEDHVALRASGRYVARLERHRPAPKASQPWSTTGTALITGGLGALGLHVARWLAGKGVKHLVLTGRRGAESAEAKAAVASLEAMGVAVTVAKADVADAAAVAAVLADIEARLPPLTAVFHAAGVLDDGVLMQQDTSRLARVLAPKVRGAWNLHVQTRDLPLDAFLLFSSASSAIGTPGQGNYAAANAALDALVHHRRDGGLAAHCINWGAWAGGGMASDETLASLERRGVRAMRPEAAIEAMSRVLEGEAAQVVVADIDWPRFREVYELGGARPLVAEMPRAEVAVVQSGPAALVEELRARPAAERRPRLEQWLRETVARTLGFADIEAVSLTTGFFDIGMDSLMAVELRNRLQAAVGQPLAGNVAFNYPTVTALAGHLAEILFPAADTAALATTPAAVTAAHLPAVHAFPASGGDPSQEPIAIVGIGCRFPGGADSPEAFWQLLQSATSAIREVPPERWDIDAFYDPHLEGPDKMNTRWGGFLDGIDQFDFSFFGLSRREAAAMDPMQRLVLEVAWESLENAGIAPPRLAASATGVFFGVGNSDYHTLLLTPPDRGGTGMAISIIANRLSYLLDLRGPSVAIDTACSSSLVAVHLACQSLRTGESDLALAGGVNVLLDPLLTVATSQAGMMARDGRCKTFAATADGYVRSEGCGAVVLKRLSDARRDGDRILALIRGSAVNQDGRSIGLTAPNGLAQQAVIRRALRGAGVTAAEVDYVEAHGTGTPLGDGIEVQALAQVLGEGRSPERKCGLGSVKTNIGHLEAAAGIAGLIKTTLALRHGVIPPHLLAGGLNPALELERTPFLIPTMEHPVDIRPRLAGVSSFGFGGTNAHVVLEAPPEQASSSQVDHGETPLHETPAMAPGPVEPPSPVLLLLSAKHPRALQELAGRYATFLERSPAVSLAAVCATAASGRAHFSHRLALIADSIAALREQLAAASAGQVPAGAFQGQVGSPGAGALAQPAEGATTPVLPGCDVPPELDPSSHARSRLEGAARLYVAGATLDWESLYSSDSPPRLALPTYPFQRQRCWLGPTEIKSYARAPLSTPRS